MKLYADYIKERENIECEYTDDCFVTYKAIDDESVFIMDMYSSPKVRGTKVMLTMMDNLFCRLKEQYTYAFGNTYTSTNGWERSDKLLKEFGFKFTGTDPQDKCKRNYGMILGEYNGK